MLTLNTIKMAKKVSKSTEVATKENVLSLSTLTKDNVPDLLEIVNERIKALQGTKTEKEPIKVELEHFGKIGSINSVGTLISAHSSLVNREKFYNESAKVLFDDNYPNLKRPAFKVQGHSVNQWIEEIQQRVHYLVNKKELDKLKATKATLETHLSEEAKLAKDLAKIQQNLNSNEIE